MDAKLQQTCEIARRKWLEEASQDKVLLKRALLAKANSREGQFELACYQAAQGDATALVEHLCSDHPLSSRDRVFLAFLVRGALGNKSSRGRPIDHKVHVASRLATEFYARWRAENKRAGVSDHGKAGAMKDETARIVTEHYSLSDKYEAVRELMERPRSRRRR